MRGWQRRVRRPGARRRRAASSAGHSCAGVLLPQVSSPAGVPAPGHGGRAGRAAPGDLRRRVGGGRGGAAEQGGGAILRRGPVRAQPRLHAAALRLLRGARGRGAAAGALRGGLRVRRRQRAGNAGIHAGTAWCLAGAALPRPLPAVSGDRVCGSELRTRYHITAIPRLVILKPSGEVITDKGRKQIRERGLACFQNWVEAADIFQNFSG
ncbi:nucleoredoxin-like protein 2 isoform X1 [Bubalus bubalis]|uniref:nucleoredoxin-like protein 2 isoform X1 n=1 Tax=Bubalus bubalis TaxID=89462 RepID=UPI001D10390B|nr:nucleoredoxin-like protein 2 isoform X1 [Bubalus bubalis]